MGKPDFKHIKTLHHFNNITIIKTKGNRFIAHKKRKQMPLETHYVHLWSSTFKPSKDVSEFCT